MPIDSPNEPQGGAAQGISGVTRDKDGMPGLSLPAAVLRAVAAMARNSKRQQAELGVALQRAGLTLDLGHQEAVLRHLCDTADVEGVIPLSDGGILLSVTAAGMERALR